MRKLGSSFPNLPNMLPTEQGIEGLAIHASLARGGAHVASAPRKNCLRVGQLEIPEIFLSRVPPREQRQVLGDRSSMPTFRQIGSAKHPVAMQRRQTLNEILQ